jgi:hypothetical protein
MNMMEAIQCTPFNRIVGDFPNGVVDGTGSHLYSNVVGGYSLQGEHISVSYANPATDPLEVFVSITWQDKRGDTRRRYLTTKRTR